MSSVTLRELTKKYDGNDAYSLDSVSLDVAHGEFICLVGPSGCGKTTALRMIAGLESVTSGDIEIGDRVVNDLAPRDRDIALVFQSYALYPHMTVSENMSFGLKLRKVPKDEIKKAVIDAARILDLEQYLDRKPGQLSGGQRQRVALGRAIVRNPSAFLMDEPLSNLDAKLRVQTRAEIARLHHRLGATMIYVTHDQVEAMTMADRIAVINLGKLEQVGSPRDLYDRPANQFVGGFIGSPSMNFVPMHVESVDDGLRLVSDGGDMDVALGGVESSVIRRAGVSEVVMGVRPEHIDHVPRSGGGLQMRASVDVIEFLGNDEHVHLTSGDHVLVAIVDARTPLTIGDSLTLSASIEAIHLFHPETGAALK
ncbi:MAG TPA: sn-glycerol-3-phosphate ABC transporter ATP-binding protein UgpC [Acidimicrobiales bacterium]|nr:sn-glycerol-3-phosphate ABC transporter ATP-binding protein UgpC [Acidimicrobiales bacterium]